MIALGLDLGTSSIKALLLGPGVEYEESCAYTSPDFAGLLDTVRLVCARLNDRFPLHRVDALGLSGRTGTYALMDQNGTVGPWIEWFSGGREAALEKLLAAFPAESFMDMIGMPHPRLSSYPVPMLLTSPPGDRTLVQPKDALMQHITGRCLSDAGSWRGLYHPEKAEYSPELLAWAHASADNLPQIGDMALLCAAGASLTGLREGTPVYTGQNDFYSALYGMGIDGPGCGFDVTGTSEHIGLTRPLPGNSALITSPYLQAYVHYGVTASSGPSLTWGRHMFGAEEPGIRPHAPIFLPYLQGERAPVFDASARGMFVGLTPHTDNEDLRYAVYEGVAFSMRNIQDALGEDMPAVLRITGGASRSPLLCRLKASLLGCRVQRERLDCGSAMGAVRSAGGQWQRDMEEYAPDDGLRDMLEPRYQVYARLYAAWQTVTRDTDTGHLFGKD